MGNTPSAERRGSREQGPGPRLSSAAERQWMNVHVDQLYDEEFLKKQYIQSGFATSAQALKHASHSSSGMNTATTPRTPEFRDQYGNRLDESDEIADSIVAFAQTEMAMRSRFNAERLAYGLAIQSRLRHSTDVVLDLRLHLLQYMHAVLEQSRGAMTILDQYPIPVVFREWIARSQESSPSSAITTNPLRQSGYSVALPHDVQLGIKIFFTLLESLLEEGGDQVQRKAFLDDLIEMMHELGPLSLASERLMDYAGNSKGPPDPLRIASDRNKVDLPYCGAKRWCEFGVHFSVKWDDDLSPEHIIDSLQEYLEAASTNLSLSDDSLSEAKDQYDRSKAVSCLLYLAYARGSVRDFLVAIKILMNAGKTMTTLQQYEMAQDEATAQEYQNALNKSSKIQSGIKIVEEPSGDSSSLRLKSPLPGGTEDTSTKKKNIIKNKSQRPNRDNDGGNDGPNSSNDGTGGPLNHLREEADSMDRFSKLQLRPILQHLAAAKPRALPSNLYGDAEEREIWSCGQNSYGELGHGDTSMRKTFSQVKFAQGKEIVQICAGNEHTLALASDGVVYTTGYNDNGQCGQGMTGRVGQFTAIEKLRGNVVTQIHAYNGCEHSLVVTERGEIASFGYNYRGQLGHGNTTSEMLPKFISSLEQRRVTVVSCSYYHTALACDNGELFTFGRNDVGQLGLGDVNDRKLPCKVDALATQGHRITGIGCGQYHTIAVTEKGKLMSFGKNDYGQLGIDSSEVQRLPVAVRGAGIESRVCVQLRCGYYHTIALCISTSAADGSEKSTDKPSVAFANSCVYSFGRNDYGQLGLGHITQRVYGPQMITELDGKHILQIAAGCYHTLAVADSGVVFVFGRNNHGQLGTGDTTERHSPHALDLFLGKRIAVVAAGFYHSIILTGGEEENPGSEQNIEITDASPFTAPAILCIPKLQPLVRGSATSGNVKPSADDQERDQTSNEHNPSPERDSGNDRDEDDARMQQSLLNDSQTDLSIEVPANGHEYALDAPVGNLIDTLSEKDAAVVLLAQLDRLSAAYIPKADRFPRMEQSKFFEMLVEKQKLPTPSTPATDEFTGPAFPGSQQLYTIDVRADTFEQLATLINHFSVHRHTGPNDPGAVVRLEAYLILACLRLVQANLAQLLRSGMGPFVLQLRQVALSDTETSSDATDEMFQSFVGPFQELSQALARLRVLLLREIDQQATILTELRGKNQQATDDLDRSETGACNSQTDYNIAICAVQTIRDEAIHTLMVGFELFYPCPCAQNQLISYMLHASARSAVTPKASKSTFSSGCQLPKELESDLPTKQTCAAILRAVLSRMADDGILLKFMAGTTRFCIAPTLKEARDHHSRPLLDGIIKSLVEKVSYFTLQALGAQPTDDPNLEPRQSSGEVLSVSTELNQPELPKVDQTTDAKYRHDFAPYVTLLAAIQKHLCSSSASSLAQASTDGPEEASTPLSTRFDSVEAIFEYVHSKMDKHENQAIDLLLSYSKLVMNHCAEALTNVVNREPLPSPTTHTSMRSPRDEGDATTPTYSLVSKVHLDALEYSLLGQVLPSLASSLILFADHGALSAAILPLVVDLLDRLDHLNRQVEESNIADIQYIKELGESMLENQNSSSNAQKTRSSGITKANTAIAQAAKFAWLLQVEQALAELGSALAASQIVGNGLQLPRIMSVVASTGETERMQKWIQSRLFKSGLDAVAFVSTTFRLWLNIPPLQAPRNETMGKTIPSRAELMAFLQSSRDKSSPGARFCQWVRQSCSKCSMAYRMMLVQGKRSSDGELLASIENRVFMVLLKTCGLLFEAYQYAATLNTDADEQSGLAPARYINIWKLIIEMRRWLLNQRSTWKQHEEQEQDAGKQIETEGSSRHGFDLVCHEVSLRCDLIESFAFPNSNFSPPATPSMMHAFTPAYGSSLLLQAMQSKYDEQPFLKKYPQSKWRIIRTYVHTLTRWRTLTRQSKEILAQVKMPSVCWKSYDPLALSALAFLKTLPENVLSPSQETETDGITAPPTGFPLDLFIKIMLEHQLRTTARVNGLRGFRELLSTVQMDCIQVQLLENLANVMTVHSDRHAHLHGHLFYQTEAIGEAKQLQISIAFEQLYGLIIQKMEGIIEGAPMAMMSAHLEFDQPVLLSLLRCWTMHFGVGFYSFLSDGRIFATLSQLIQALSKKRRHASITTITTPSSSSSAVGITNLSKAQFAAYHKRLRNYREAAWRLFRYLCTQISAQAAPLHTSTKDGLVLTAKFTRSNQAQYIPLEPSFRPIYSIFYDELNRGLAKMMPIKASTALGASSSGDKDTASSKDSTSARRSQELILAPHRFSDMEVGLMIPAKDILTAPKCSDFSITVWLHLTQNATGKPRVVLVRGNSFEKAPFVLLKDTDRRLEVGLEINNQVERMTSKGTIPLNKWCHVAIVSEANKLRLYLNGTLDAQRTNNGVPEKPDLPFYVGRTSSHLFQANPEHDVDQPEDEVRMGGFEGMIGQLRYHNRALSPIHVRIVCDQGPPETAAVVDRRCYELSIALILLAESSEGIAAMSTFKWIQSFIRLLLGGTPRVQQLAVRLLGKVLPFVSPELLDRIEIGFHNAVGGVSDDSTVQSFESGSDFVRYLLRIAGLAMWRARYEQSDPSNIGGEKESSNNASESTKSKTPVGMDFPINIASNLLSKLELDSSMRPTYSAAETSHHGFLLAAEICLLLRTLGECAQWRDLLQTLVNTTLDQYVEDILAKVDSIDTSEGTIVVGKQTLPIQALRIAEGLTSLCALGGLSEDLRIGVQVRMDHTTMTSTIVGYDNQSGTGLGSASGASTLSSSIAHVVMAPSLEEANKSSQHSVGWELDQVGFHPWDCVQRQHVQLNRTIKALRMNMDELTVCSELKSLCGSIQSPFQSPVESALTNPYNANFIAFASQFLHRRPPLYSQDAETPSESPLLSKMTLCTILYSQSRSMVLKILCCIARESINNRIDILASKDIISALVQLSIENDASREYIALDEIEARALLLRVLLYQKSTGNDNDKVQALGMAVPPPPPLESPVGAASQASREPQAIIRDALSSSAIPPVGDLRTSSYDRLDDDEDDEDDLDIQEDEAGPAPELIEELLMMGFPEEWCVMALREHENDLDGASTWIIENLDMLNNLCDTPGSASASNPVGMPGRGRQRGLFEGTADDEDDEDEGNDEDEDIDMSGKREDFASNVSSSPQPKNPTSEEGSGFEDATDSFDHETATEGLSEIYFNNEQSGFGCNLERQPYFNINNMAQRSVVEDGAGGSDEPGSGLRCRLRSLFTQANTMEYSQLVQLTEQWERRLSISYARNLLLLLLESVSTVREDDQVGLLKKHEHLPEILLSSQNICHLSKALLYRGLQFSAWSLNTPIQTFEALFTQLLSIPAYAERLTQDLVAKFQAELETAAASKQYEATTWSSRELKLGDEKAFGDPNVECASWGLKFLLQHSPVHSTTLSIASFSHLCKCLTLSSNISLKLNVFQLINMIIAQWKHYILREEIVPRANESPSNSLPSLEQIKAATELHLCQSRVENWTKSRLAREKAQGRLYYSRYFKTLAEVMLLLRHVTKLIDARIQGDSNDPTIKSTLLSGDATIASENHTSSKAPLAPAGLRLVQCGANALRLRWRASATQGVAVTNYVLEIAPASGAEEDSFVQKYTGSSTGCKVDCLDADTSYKCRVRALSEDGPSEWSELLIARTESKIPFTFDRNCANTSMRVSESGMNVSYLASESWATIIGTEGFIVGRNYWEVRIDKSSTSYLFIGVAAKQVNTGTFLGGDEFGWGYIGDRALYHRRNKVRAYGDRFIQGDVIGITLDMDQGTLSYSKNGLDLGVAFDNLAGELYPAIAFYNHHQKVSLMPKSFQCPGAGIAVKGAPSEASLEDVLEVMQLMQIVQHGELNAIDVGIDQELLLYAFKWYGEWKHNNKYRCMTRAGYELHFDISEEACSSFGFKARSRVRTPRGEAAVIGVADDKIWFLVDGESGAWFFNPTEVTISESLDPDAGATPRTGHYPSKENTGDKKEKGGLQTELDKLVQAAEMSFDEFKHLLFQTNWTVALDEMLVGALNDKSDSKRISPWNLTIEQICDVSKSTGIRSKLKIPDALKAVAKNTDPYDLSVACRMSLLYVFNDKLARVINFIDLSDELVKKPSPAAITPAYDLAGLLKQLRGSILWTTKRSIIDCVISRTATRPKKAEDDYDYPEDLPQILLNRPKAAMAKGKPEPEMRLNLSMFGQAFDELHFLDPTILRIGYSHPMDDGQVRAFKAKFEGEGVDDYGGPYRECFSMFAAELQTTHTVVQSQEGSASKSTLECVFSLFLPSPNMRNAIGDIRDKFVINPGLCVDPALKTQYLYTENGIAPPDETASSVYLEMYNFLGQLFGVAIRSRVLVRFDLPALVWKWLVGERVEWTDLEEIDSSLYSFLSQLRELATDERKQDELAELLEELDFTTHLSNGQLVKIGSRGKDAVVTADNFHEYIQGVIDARLNESKRALDAMRDGLASIVPATVLTLLTWKQLEKRICGQEGIDIDLLQENTEYDEDISVESPFIQSFWRVLRAFNDEDQCAFLRFVWARSRLPLSNSEFHQKFKIQASAAEGSSDDPDTWLPKSHTCFFSLSLPKYSSDEIMAKQIRYAIHNCVEMDGDFRLAEAEMTGWTDLQAEDVLAIS